MNIDNINKKTIVLAIFLLVFLCLAIIFAFSIKVGKIEPTATENKAKKIGKKEMVENYKNDIKVLATSYGDATNTYASTSKKEDILPVINNLKLKMTEIIVPSEFKDMHLNLFLSIVSFENYLANNELAEKKKSEKLFYVIKQEYSWLNL